MADWSSSSAIATPTHISVINSVYSPGASTSTMFNAFSTLSVTNWVANLALYFPIEVPFPYPVRRVFWLNGSTITTSNVDMGIYDDSGTKLYSTGSTAMSGASTAQYVTVSPDLILYPGVRYYLAWVCDNTTSRATTVSVAATASVGRIGGILQQSSAFTLPAAATFASFDATVNLQYCGITRTTTGF